MHDHATGLLRLATRLAGSAEAEDLVQATYVRALEHGDPVRRRRSWMRRVLVNERHMDLRRRHRRDARDQASADLLEPAADVEHVVHTLEVARIVGELVESLDDDVRIVVRERYFDGDTSAEIARRHAIPAGTVRWRLKSGLDQLRDQLDARFGGRRAVWAGAFAPALESTGTPTLSPTLSTPAASKTAMSIKLFVGAGIVAATAGGVVVASSSFSSEPTPEVAPATDIVAAQPKAVASESAPPSEVVAEDEPAQPESAHLKAAWEARRSKIRKAHAAAGGLSWQAADEAAGEPEHPNVGACEDKDCVAQLGAEVHEMINGCKDAMDTMPKGLVLEAQVIGAPDVGTVVESVEVVEGEGASPELVECLTEQMYTLDLNESEANLDQTIRMGLGTKEVDLTKLDDADLDERTRAALEKAMAAKGLDKEGEALVHVLSFDAWAHDPAAPERPTDD